MRFIVDASMTPMTRCIDSCIIEKYAYMLMFVCTCAQHVITLMGRLNDRDRVSQCSDVFPNPSITKKNERYEKNALAKLAKSKYEKKSHSEYQKKKRHALFVSWRTIVITEIKKKHTMELVGLRLQQQDTNVHCKNKPGFHKTTFRLTFETTYASKQSPI